MFKRVINFIVIDLVLFLVKINCKLEKELFEFKVLYVFNF